MPIVMYCPFITVDYKSVNGKLRIRCERALIEFADGRERKEFICKYCGSLNGWKDCTIAQSAMRHYEREEEKT